MSRRVVWITGPPGSGKTTAGRAAADALGRTFLCAGERFRAEAKRRGLGLPEFSALAEKDREVDEALDASLMAAAEPGTIVDGRVVGALLRRQGIAVLAVLITAKEPVRAARVAARDGGDVPAAVAAIRARSASERARYRRWYDLDLDEEPFDAVVDASEMPPEAVARRLEELVRAADALP